MCKIKNNRIQLTHFLTSFYFHYNYIKVTKNSIKKTPGMQGRLTEAMYSFKKYFDNFGSSIEDVKNLLKRLQRQIYWILVYFHLTKQWR